MTLSNSKTISITTLNSRLVNMKFTQNVFFRKFYSLASERIRTMMNKLDLVQTYMKVNSDKSSSSSSSSQSLSSPCCHQVPSQSQQGSPKSDALLFQILFKKIWLVFEHAIGFETNKSKQLTLILLTMISFKKIYFNLSPR